MHLPTLRLLFVRAMLLCGALLPGLAVAKSASTPLREPARVMLLGLFHFDNPGLDAVKFKPIDVRQPAEQAYLVALAERIARFKPTKVLLEYPAKNDALINQRYTDHLADRFDLPLNEIYQLGFRIARLTGHTRVFGFDEQPPPAKLELWGSLEKEAPAKYKQLLALIGSLSERYEREHRTLGLREILARSNSPAEDRLNKGFYMLLNDVAAEKGTYHGADASAHWWHRNLRMYALVQMHAQPGDRVVVIAGSGHAAILRDLLAADGERVEEDVRPYL